MSSQLLIKCENRIKAIFKHAVSQKKHRPSRYPISKKPRERSKETGGDTPKRWGYPSTQPYRGPSNHFKGSRSVGTREGLVEQRWNKRITNRFGHMKRVFEGILQVSGDLVRICNNITECNATKKKKKAIMSSRSCAKKSVIIMHYLVKQ